MNLAGSVAMDGYSIALLLVIYHYVMKHNEDESLSQRLYIVVLQATIVMAIIDILSRFDGQPGTIYPTLNHIGNFLLFLLSQTLPSAWLLYVYQRVYGDEARTRRLFRPLLAVSAVNAVLTVLTLSSGWYYYIDSGNIYHRGQLFWIPVSMTMVLIGTAFVVIAANRDRIGRKHYLPLLFHAVPPFVCIALQLVFYGTSLILSGVVLSFLAVFLNVQNDRVFTDYLTGVGNRKRLESYLEKKVGASTPDRAFSAILVDLDNFKSINDTYGHDVGDRALRISAELLRSCIRSDDLIARPGGDEFCIVLSTFDQSDLEAVVRRIDERVAEHNASSDEPYALGFSMGYAVYDPGEHLNAEQFQKRIDALMYEDKKRSETGGNRGS